MEERGIFSLLQTKRAKLPSDMPIEHLKVCVQRTLWRGMLRRRHLILNKDTKTVLHLTGILGNMCNGIGMSCLSLMKLNTGVMTWLIWYNTKKPQKGINRWHP